MIRLKFTQALKIYKSDKDFIFYKVEGGKLVNFKLTNDISKHRDSFSNQFKIVSDLRGKIKNNLRIEL